MKIEELKEEIFQALGEVSMSWDPVPSGIFDSSKASDIGDRLMDMLKKQIAVVDAARALYGDLCANDIDHNEYISWGRLRDAIGEL